MQLSAKSGNVFDEIAFLMAAYDRDYIKMNLLDFYEHRFSISFLRTHEVDNELAYYSWIYYVELFFVRGFEFMRFYMRDKHAIGFLLDP